MDNGNTKIPSMQYRLSSATLLQLTFPWEEVAAGFSMEEVGMGQYIFFVVVRFVSQESVVKFVSCFVLSHLG